MLFQSYIHTLIIEAWYGLTEIQKVCEGYDLLKSIILNWGLNTEVDFDSLLIHLPTFLSLTPCCSLLVHFAAEYMLIWSFIGVGVLLVPYSVSVPFIHDQWVMYLHVYLFSYWAWSSALLLLSSQARLPLAWTASLSHPATHLCTINWTLVGMWSSPRISYDWVWNLTPCRSVGECTSWLPVDRHPPITVDSLSHNVLSTIYSRIHFWRYY